MSNVFSLDSLREEIEQEFAPVKVDLGDGESVVLRNILRVDQTGREKAFKLLEDLEGLSGGDAEEGFTSSDDVERSADVALKILGVVAETEKQGAKLVKAVGNDVALSLRLFEKWMRSTQAGEAQRSDS